MISALLPPGKHCPRAPMVEPSRSGAWMAPAGFDLRIRPRLPIQSTQQVTLFMREDNGER